MSLLKIAVVKLPPSQRVCLFVALLKAVDVRMTKIRTLLCLVDMKNIKKAFSFNFLCVLSLFRVWKQSCDIHAVLVYSGVQKEQKKQTNQNTQEVKKPAIIFNQD